MTVREFGLSPIARRRLTWVFGCSILFSACVRNPPRTEPIVTESIAFLAQTGPDTIVEGSFEGTAAVRGGWIDVVVTKSSLTVPPGPRERWRSLTVRAFLAVDYRPGLWTAPVESRPVNVWRFLEFPAATPARDRMSIAIKDTLHFLVPIPPGASLATSRLAIEVEWVTLYRDYGQTESNYAFSGTLVTTRPPDP